MENANLATRDSLARADNMRGSMGAALGSLVSKSTIMSPRGGGGRHEQVKESVKNMSDEDLLIRLNSVETLPLCEH